MTWWSSFAQGTHRLIEMECPIFLKIVYLW
jgi:hypothetical protein